jgi:hypothetical protein
MFKPINLSPSITGSIFPSIAQFLFQFGQLMEELKVTDGTMRGHLAQLFGQTQELLDEIVRLENVIDKQLQQEDSTRDYQNKIRTFMRLLQQEECPVVVAGMKVKSFPR